MLQFLPEPTPPSPPLSTVSHNDVLFSSTSCLVFHFYFSTITIHPCTLRTGERILCVICIWYECLCACMWFLEGRGWVGGFTEGAAIRTGSTASKVQQRAVQGSRVVPSWQTASPLSPSLRGAWKGSHTRCHLPAVPQWASLYWRFLCVLWEKDKEKGGKTETDRDKWLGSSR